MKHKSNALILGAMAGLAGISFDDKPRFRFSEDIIFKYRERWSSGESAKVAYDLCKEDPVASKLSASERRKWQRELIEAAEEF